MYCNTYIYVFIGEGNNMSFVKKVSLLLVIILLLYTCSACKSQDTSSNSVGMTEEELLAQIKNEASKNNGNLSSPDDSQENSSGKVVDIMNVKIGVVSPTINQSLLLANDTVYNWSKSYTVKSSESHHNSGDIFACKSVTFEWSCNEKPEYYTLKVGTSKSLEGANSFKLLTNKFEIYNIFVGKKYYWQVIANYANGEVASDVFTFETVQSPRTMQLYGVSNTRDIGGYITESGKRVKQGMIYRGAVLDGIKDSALYTALTDYGIKTDLDLRKANEGSAGTSSPLGGTVNYIHVPSPYYLGQTTTGINNPENWPALKQIFEVFADSGNYPIMMHCSLGRDRTGNIAMILSGLLGVSKKDILLDYELSFFSYTGCQDKASVDHLVSQIEKTYNYIESNYGSAGDSFSTRVEKFLLNVGVSQEKINAIKSNLLE